MADLSSRHDVLVIGGGNAALCAAIAARRDGASVLVLEAAPRFYRGGNTRHTRNMRCAHDSATETLSGPYTEAEFLDDLMRVTGGRTDPDLARLMIAESKEVLDWIQAQGVRFQPSLGGTLSLGRTNSFFLGGGRAMLNALYLTAERLGVAVRYEAEVTALDIADGTFLGATVRHAGRSERVEATTLVAAAGGFEANIDWLKQGWGEAAENFLIRGTPYNRGTVLRFYDEGEDIWPKRYAIWGRLVAQQPGQIAYILVDDPALGLFMPSLYPPITAATIRELAGKLALDPDALEATVRDFNAAIRPGRFDPTNLDDCRTEGLDPPKTHWARPIATPPFHAYPVRPGITFTYLGVRVDAEARLVMADGGKAGNMFAAGEIMAGNVLGQGYAAGIGMTIGAVFGRIAGRGAAAEARRRRNVEESPA